MRQEQVNVTLSIDPTAEFVASYQFDELLTNLVDIASLIEVVGLIGYDADDGSEVDLHNLLTLQIETIRVELLEQCTEHAEKLLKDEF